MKVKVKKIILGKREKSPPASCSSPSPSPSQSTTTTATAVVSTRSPRHAALSLKVCDIPAAALGAAITPITTTTLPVGIAKSPPITATSNVATSHPTTPTPHAWLPSPSTPADIISTSHQYTSTSSCHSKPRFKGVRRRSWGRWVSEIRLPRSRDRVWLGSFASAEQAACAFEAASIALRGGGGGGANFPGRYKGLNNFSNNLYLSKANIGKCKSDLGMLKKEVRSIAASAVAAAFLSGGGALQSTSSSAPPYLEEYRDTNSESEVESVSESRTDPPRLNVNEGGAIWEADLLTLSELQSDLDSNIIHLPYFP